MRYVRDSAIEKNVGTILNSLNGKLYTCNILEILKSGDSFTGFYKGNAVTVGTKAASLLLAAS